MERILALLLIKLTVKIIAWLQIRPGLPDTELYSAMLWQSDNKGASNIGVCSTENLFRGRAYRGARQPSLLQRKGEREELVSCFYPTPCSSK